MEKNNIFTLDELSKHTEKEILKFHGLGKASLPVLRKALGEKGFTIKNN